MRDFTHLFRHIRIYQYLRHLTVGNCLEIVPAFPNKTYLFTYKYRRKNDEIL